MTRSGSRILAVLALLGTASLLAGCVSPAEQRAADDGRCLSYGFRPRTDAYAACLQNIDLDRSADRREFLNRPYPGGYGYGFGWRRRWY